MTDGDPDANGGPDASGGPNASGDGADAPGGEPSVADAVAAGAVLFDAGEFRAASDAWTAAGPPLAGGDDERLRRGLAAAALAAAACDEGRAAAERADAAADALAEVGASHRGIDVAAVRAWARRVAAGAGETGSEAADAGATRPPRLRVDGAAGALDELSLPAAGVAAAALAGAGGPGERETMADAAAFAREERGTGRTRFAELLFAYLREPDARPQIAARIGDRVDRERRKRRDVDDLF